uniref:Uncharacterized protein n=1 Tax=Rhizophora mucronata TaxID=61149 RepID=A0A2P2QBN6_RHIMU
MLLIPSLVYGAVTLCYCLAHNDGIHSL